MPAMLGLVADAEEVFWGYVVENGVRWKTGMEIGGWPILARFFADGYSLEVLAKDVCRVKGLGNGGMGWMAE